MVNARRFSVLRLVARALGVAGLVWLIVTVGLVVALRYVPPPATAMMLAQPEPLADIAYEWRSRAEISASAARAVIASEDQRFTEHHGVDFVQLDAAIDGYRAGDELRGASTITQQVAKNLFLWPGRSFVRKALEVYFALLIETFWPKQRILEVYLNVAELGPGVFGVEAAAQRFFDASAAALNDRQAALLAAVLPNPRALLAAKPSAYVRGRQTWVLGQMKVLEARGHYRELEW